MPTKVKEASSRIWLNLLEMPWDEGRLIVRSEMSRLGLAQEDLAYKLRRAGRGASLRSVRAWLNGQTKPSYDAVREIVIVLATVSAGDSPKASFLSHADSPTSSVGTSYGQHLAAPVLPRQVSSPRKAFQAA